MKDSIPDWYGVTDEEMEEELFAHVQKNYVPFEKTIKMRRYVPAMFCQYNNFAFLSFLFYEKQ